MPSIKHGNMMSAFNRVDHFIVCVSTKPSKRSHVSWELFKEYPDLEELISNWIKENTDTDGFFGVRAEAKVGLFQNRLKGDINLGVIAKCVHQLITIANANPTKKYALEIPSQEEPFFTVSALINMLPDNVEVWRADTN